MVVVPGAGNGAVGVPYSPRRAAANRALFPIASVFPSARQVVSSLVHRMVTRPTVLLRRAVFGRRRRSSEAGGSGAASATDKVV